MFCKSGIPANQFAIFFFFLNRYNNDIKYMFIEKEIYETHAFTTQNYKLHTSTLQWMDILIFVFHLVYPSLVMSNRVATCWRTSAILPKQTSLLSWCWTASHFAFCLFILFILPQCHQAVFTYVWIEMEAIYSQLEIVHWENADSRTFLFCNSAFNCCSIQLP